MFELLVVITLAAFFLFCIYTVSRCKPSIDDELNYNSKYKRKEFEDIPPPPPVPSYKAINSFTNELVKNPNTKPQLNKNSQQVSKSTPKPIPKRKHYEEDRKRRDDDDYSSISSYAGFSSGYSSSYDSSDSYSSSSDWGGGDSGGGGCSGDF